MPVQDIESDDQDPEEEEVQITKQESEMETRPLGSITQEEEPDAFNQNLAAGRQNRMNTEMQFNSNFNAP